MEMPNAPNHALAFEAKMRRENLSPMVVETFRRYYEQLMAGEKGLIRDREIQAVLPGDLKRAADLSGYRAGGTRLLTRTVMIRLNGGLGTSMGLTRAKSFIRVRGEMSFLDIIVRQASEAGARLALMNSFSTHEDTLAYLGCSGVSPLPLLFVQHKFPKILRADLSPADWPRNPSLEWNPPGHGDVYTALYASGVLDRLVKEGIEYALIANSDNLGATLDPDILGYFASEKFPFMMEVAERTPSDNKGGHLARYRNGGFLLRESAQCPQDEMAAFEDIERFCFFNTNNIWIHLPTLQSYLDQFGALKLPIIVNPKALDPRDKKSPPVYQIETAMGAAISSFEGATAVRVDRSRFMPVKKCTDLMAMRSDCFVFADGHRLTANPDRTLGPIRIRLDDAHYAMIDDFDARFPFGPPSLVECESLEIKGDVRFEENVILRGRVSIVNSAPLQARIPSGAVIDGEVRFS